MKPEDINRAIAEHCGWDVNSPKFHDNMWLYDHKDGSRAPQFPNYHGDLNAMHEAERTLNNGQALKYQDVLIWSVCTLDALFPATRDCAMQGFLHHATSAQRAEAFLRTIGKWNDQ